MTERTPSSRNPTAGAPLRAPGADGADGTAARRRTAPKRRSPAAPFDIGHANGNGNGNSNRALIGALAASKVFRDYERAFNDMTGLPLALQPLEAWQLPHHGRRNENPFCSLMSQKSHSCAHCLQQQSRLCDKAGDGPRTMDCPSGLCDTAVPVRLSDKLIGFLQTGQLFRQKPSQVQFERVVKLVEKWGVDVDRAALKKAFFSGKVVSSQQHAAVVKLLSVFAQHLSVVSNQVMIQQANSELPVVSKAKEYIFEHQAEKLRLSQVARAVHMSTFYFCKTFKKAAGINFTDYLSRVRIERAKNLLLNPNLRVSEIAYEVGFQSLTHFNRVFRKIAGQSPTDYRAQLLAR